MIYGFDTTDEAAATAALVVYAIYRSRDKKRYKVSPSMWEQIERFIKSSAKRAETIPTFIEKFKPKVMCGTISPRWCEAGVMNDIGLVSMGDGSLLGVSDDDRREFLTPIIAKCNEPAVRWLYKEPSWIVLLVRERLEREKTIEKKLKIEG